MPGLTIVNPKVWECAKKNVDLVVTQLFSHRARQPSIIDQIVKQKIISSILIKLISYL